MKMARDLTIDGRNPAGALKARYAELMSITDAATLSIEVVKTVQDTQFSVKNRTKFDSTMDKIQGQLDKIQGYVTNFILSAGGDQVI